MNSDGGIAIWDLGPVTYASVFFIAVMVMVILLAFGRKPK